MNAEKRIASALITLSILALGASASAQDAKPAAQSDKPAASDTAPPQIEDDRGPVRPDGADPAPAPPPPRKANRAKAASESEDTLLPRSARPVYLPQEPEMHEEPTPQKPPAQPHIQRWSAGAGFTGAVVNSPGFDPYSKSNTLPMLSVFGTFTPWPTRPVSVHLAFQYDYGGASERARGAEASLDIHRLALGLEGRYVPLSRMMLFVRAMPSALHLGGTIKDPYLGAQLESGSWNFSADVTGGAAARIGSVGHAELPSVSFWIALDMGYRFAPPAVMRFRPGGLTEDDLGRKFGDVPMPSLDLSGFIGKLSVSISF